MKRVRSDDGTPRGIRTPDLLLRRQLLYPAELLAHMISRTIASHPKLKASEARSIWKGGRRERRELLPTLERVMGIEPTYPAWKAGVLPLNYTRTSSPFSLEIIPYKMPVCQQLSKKFFPFFLSELRFRNFQPLCQAHMTAQEGLAAFRIALYPQYAPRFTEGKRRSPACL